MVDDTFFIGKYIVTCRHTVHSNLCLVLLVYVQIELKFMEMSADTSWPVLYSTFSETLTVKIQQCGTCTGYRCEKVPNIYGTFLRSMSDARQVVSLIIKFFIKFFCTLSFIFTCFLCMRVVYSGGKL